MVDKKRVEFKTKEGKVITFSANKKRKQKKRFKKKESTKIIRKGKNKLEVKIKVFANDKKGRKGEYYYIREKGRKGKYYKKKEGENLQTYIEFYKRDLITKRGGVSKKRIEKEKRLEKKAKKYPKIEDIIEQGYAEYLVEKAKTLTPTRVRASYMNLLLNKGKGGDGKSIVRDRELLEIITRSENVEKWKHRVLFEVMVYNDKGEIMATINNTKIKMLGEVKKEILDELYLGMDFDVSYGFTGELDKLERNGYRINMGKVSKGIIRDIKIKMIFRKGK